MFYDSANEAGRGEERMNNECVIIRTSYRLLV